MYCNVSNKFTIFKHIEKELSYFILICVYKLFLQFISIDRECQTIAKVC